MENQSLDSANDKQPDRGATATLLRRVRKWAELLLVVAGVASLLSSALYFWVATRGLDLVVWYEKVLPVYPSKGSDDLTLPLSFENEAARAVNLVKVNVSNLGDSSIGSQETLWRLTLSAPAASRLELVGDLKPHSPRITVSRTPSVDRNAISLQLGVLERRAQVDFWLMAVYDKPTRTRLEVSTSLAGLPRPETTYRPLEERLAVKLWPFMFPLWVIGLSFVAVKEHRDSSKRLRLGRDALKTLREKQQERESQDGKAQGIQRISEDDVKQLADIVKHMEDRHWRRTRLAMVKSIAGNVLAIVFAAGLGGYYAAMLAGWIMSWFI